MRHYLPDAGGRRCRNNTAARIHTTGRSDRVRRGKVTVALGMNLPKCRRRRRRVGATGSDHHLPAVVQHAVPSARLPRAARDVISQQCARV
jgi:hypothetical protein